MNKLPVKIQRVYIFTGADIDDIEQEISLILSNRGIEVIQIVQSVVKDGFDGLTDTSFFWYTITLLCREE